MTNPIRREDVEERVLEHFLERTDDRREVLFRAAIGMMSTDGLQTLIEIMKIPPRANGTPPEAA